MKLGSLAVWWSPLIIVCPDRVYLSKLFLVLQSCTPWTLNNKKVRTHASLVISPVAQVYGGQHREAHVLTLPGRGPA